MFERRILRLRSLTAEETYRNSEFYRVYLQMEVNYAKKC